MITEAIRVPEVHCNHCVHSIQGALQPMDGVQDAIVHLDSRTVEVTWNDGVVDRAAIVAAIEGQGYEVAEGDDVASTRGELPLA